MAQDALADIRRGGCGGDRVLCLLELLRADQIAIAPDAVRHSVITSTRPEVTRFIAQGWSPVP
jgi:hypothetical protein